MDADDRPGALEEGIVSVARLEQQRQQAGVPVVAVNYVRGEVQLLAGVQGCRRQEGETLAVVGVGLIVLGIELGSLEIGRTVEQIDADPVQFQLIDAIADVVPPLRGGQPARGEQFGLIPALERLVEGQDDANVVTPGRDAAAGPWPHPPGPGLHQPLNLRGYKQDFQWVNSQLLLP